MKSKFYIIIYLIIIISIFGSPTVFAKEEILGNDSKNELIEYRLNLIEEELKGKVDKETLDNNIIKNLETDRDVTLTERNFYQNLFIIFITIFGLVFTIISVINVYGILSSQKMLRDSKNAKDVIEKTKIEVDDLLKEVTQSKENLITERQNIESIIAEVRSSNNEFVSERDKIREIINKVNEVNDEFNHERDQILSNLDEEKRKIQEQISSFNKAMFDIEKSFNNFNEDKDTKKFASEINEQMIALKEVAAGEIDPNIAKIAQGKLKDQEVDQIEIDKEEI